MDNADLELDDNTNDMFINNINSTLAVKRDYEKREFNYEWLEIIENALPYLDNIMRNPKRFIVNEEEIVKVELARKVTVESVIHLTQHTNLIQDIDKKTGDVQPSKILNINKEESLDTYENRFAYTLINNLRNFYENRCETTGENSFYSDKKDIKYEANTKINNENVKISLNINSLDKNYIESDKGSSELSISDRCKKIKVQLDGFMGSELMQTLGRLHVSPVRSPIRKTNVILKNPNFKIAEGLWNYIQSYEDKNTDEHDKKDYFDFSELKNDYDQAFLMTYVANRALSNSSKEFSTRKVVSQMITRLVDNILDSDEDITEDKIKEIFDRELSNITKKNNYKKEIITNIFKDKLSRELNFYNDKLSLLDEEEIL